MIIQWIPIGGVQYSHISNYCLEKFKGDVVNPDANSLHKPSASHSTPPVVPSTPPVVPSTPPVVPSTHKILGF